MWRAACSAPGMRFVVLLLASCTGGPIQPRFDAGVFEDTGDARRPTDAPRDAPPDAPADAGAVLKLDAL